MLMMIFILSLIRKNRCKVRNLKRRNRLSRQRRIRIFFNARNNLLCLFMRTKPQSTRRIWSKPRSRNWWDNIVPGFSEEEWIANFRVDKETFTFLKEQLQDSLRKRDSTFQKALTVEWKLGSALWKLASNCEYRTIGHLFGIARS